MRCVLAALEDLHVERGDARPPPHQSAQKQRPFDDLEPLVIAVADDRPEGTLDDAARAGCAGLRDRAARGGSHSASSPAPTPRIALALAVGDR